MEQVSTNHSHGGTQRVYTHQSDVTGTPMKFSVFVPDHASGTKLPVLWCLSGLTCTHANVTEKGEFRATCAQHGIIFVAPDTSPRGDDVPDDEGYDFGKGAGFYVDASQEPWAANFRSAKGWEVALFARNMFNRDYLQNVTFQAGNSGLIVGTPSDPRMFGVTFRAKN